MGIYQSTKMISLGSCAFRQWKATQSHCSKLHGYELRAKFYFGGKSLDERNWIVDFGDLDDLKAALRNIFDHTLCVAQDDPCLEDFKALHEKGACTLRVFEDGVGIERAAEVCFNIASEFIKTKYGDDRWVDKVEVFEHDLNSAVFTNPKNTDPFITVNNTQEAEKLIKQYIEAEAKKAEIIANNSLPAQSPPPNNAAPVGNQKTTGTFSNPFGGTRWGS